ncbi:MAG: allantoinase PuuE [Gammaproteobacteria bacterium WSBS_2016_MAG_OTU1]
MNSSHNNYLRDLIGYGATSPAVGWPQQARIAVQFVLNYEEGGEMCVLHGDSASESFLSEIVCPPFDNARHMTMESVYEYGGRAGVWRILNLFRERQIPLTLFAVAMAMQRHPAPIEQALKDNHEIASHGWRWINYHGMNEETERQHMQEAIDIHQQICGERPLGWYTGRTSDNTRRLVCEEGGFLYDADDYSDDLPFWSKMTDKPHLIVPYTLDSNDMRFAAPHGFANGVEFEHYLRDAFDVLYDEGETAPKMLSIGLHARIVGRPGRLAGLRRFLDYAAARDNVWFARRIDIANHWRQHYPLTETTT